jgi:polysaccharide export outer membrane protein
MNERSFSWWRTALLAALPACGGPGQYTAPPPVVPPPAAEIPYDPAKQPFTETYGVPEYVLGIGDVLEVNMRGVEQLKEEIAVRSDGTVSFSMVQNVQAAGLTLRELDDRLTKELKQYLRDPNIDIEVSQYKSKMVSLQGAILSISSLGGGKTGPGRYALKGKTTVLDLILEAGGATADAQLDRVQLIRGDKSYRLNILRVLNAGETRDNVLLQADDILFVPGIARQSKKVVILGEVNAPNVYVFPEDVTLLEAVGQAGGLTDEAIRNDIRIIRNVDGTPKMFSVNYEQIVKGKDLTKNVSLESNDVIYASRSFIGDLNDAIAKISPLLDLMLIPGTYSNIYTTGGSQVIDTGSPAGGTSQIFTQPLPGTAKAAVPADSTSQEK